MQWKQPKNTQKYHWTQHVAEKMHYYGLSEQKVLNVIKNPTRTETGIVPNTVAVMMPVGNIKKKNSLQKKTSFGKAQWGRFAFASDEASEQQNRWNQEIWVMYQIKNHESRIKNHEIEKIKKIAKLKKILEDKKDIHNSKFINQNSVNRKICIISAWRYPGVSPENNPIPEEIIRELEESALV